MRMPGTKVTLQKINNSERRGKRSTGQVLTDESPPRMKNIFFDRSHRAHVRRRRITENFMFTNEGIQNDTKAYIQIPLSRQRSSLEGG
jgi:hypothetical protein